jgi:hypothetical protein
MKPSGRPTSRAWAAVLPVLLIGAAALAAVIAFTDLAPGSRDPIARIAADPRAYDGRGITLEGTVVKIARLPGGRPAFVLAGEAGDRLLVLLADDNQPSQGRHVIVTGTVRPPERTAEERRPELPPVTLPDLLDGSGARAIVEHATASMTDPSS